MVKRLNKMIEALLKYCVLRKSFFEKVRQLHTKSSKSKALRCGPGTGRIKGLRAFEISAITITKEIANKLPTLYVTIQIARWFATLLTF